MADERATADQYWLVCSCCGSGLTDSAEENASFGAVPYPHDNGYGMCLGCGGDPKAETAEGRMGWAFATFVKARIPHIAEALKGDQRQRFLEMSFSKKTAVVCRFVEKGFMT